MLSTAHNRLAHDGARYRPAVQPWYSQAIVHGDIATRTSGRLTNNDLDLLSGNGLVTLEGFLQSAPNGLSARACMVASRNAFVCEGLIDSGGYQVSTGKLAYSESVHFRLVRYAEQFEAACILDAPTSAIGRPPFHTFKDCLHFTLRNAEYALRIRRAGRTHFLNVIQGRSLAEVRVWLSAVKPLSDPKIHGARALEGWAFAGATRTHFSIVLTVIVWLRDQGLIRQDAYLHFLGLGHPEIACVLTALQDGLRETIGSGIDVSFDNATPFVLAGEYGRALSAPSLTRQKLFVPVMDMPRADFYVGSDLPWPASSPFADRLTLGDLNIRPGRGRHAWDANSHVLLAAHNVWVQLAAIADVNRRLRLEHGDALGWLPARLVELTRTVRMVLRSEYPMTLIQRHRALLDSLSAKSRNTKLIDDPLGLDR